MLGKCLLLNSGDEGWVQKRRSELETTHGQFVCMCRDQVLSTAGERGRPGPVRTTGSEHQCPVAIHPAAGTASDPTMSPVPPVDWVAVQRRTGRRRRCLRSRCKQCRHDGWQRQWHRHWWWRWWRLWRQWAGLLKWFTDNDDMTDDSDNDVVIVNVQLCVVVTSLSLQTVIVVVNTKLTPFNAYCWL